MKSTLIMAVFMAFTFMGCQPKVQDLNVKNEKVTVNSENWDITVNRSMFSSADANVNKSCEVLNKKIEKFVNDLQDSLKADANEFFQSWQGSGEERPAWIYELQVGDSVLMANDRYVSVRLMVYTFTGGAHGITNFYTFNYDVQNQKFLTDQEVLNYVNEAQINAQLKANFKNPEGCFTTDPTLKDVTTVNFNKKSVCFTYGQYVLGAYACGVAEVTVPRAALKNDLLIK